MTTTVIFLTFVMVVVVLLLVLVVFSTNRDMFKAIQADVEELKAQSEFHEHATVPADETTEFPAVAEPAAIPLDPSNEPVWKVYRGPAGKRRCTCHGQNVETGQKVCLWPRDDKAEGAMDIYCESWMKEQGERA